MKERALDHHDEILTLRSAIGRGWYPCEVDGIQKGSVLPNPGTQGMRLLHVHSHLGDLHGSVSDVVRAKGKARPISSDCRAGSPGSAVSLQTAYHMRQPYEPVAPLFSFQVV